jgi:ABC-type antimicrobial peptide transport system permease subunit
LGVLRALGLRRLDVARSLIYEQLLLLATTVCGAVGLGLLAAHSFVPFIDVGRTARAQTPPYLLRMAWSDLIPMWAVIALSFIFALGTGVYAAARLRLSETIKLMDV